MKQYWENLVLRLDALNLRERVLVFCAAALILIFLLNMLLLEPAYQKRKGLTSQLKQEHASIENLHRQIQGKAQLGNIDPDGVNRERLKKLQQEMDGLREELSTMQSNLVPPEKMTSMLEDILKRNGRLRLISLKNLPRVGLNEVDQKTASDKPDVSTNTQDAQDTERAGIYLHAVEIVVYGNYVDMQHYLAALESTPWQLYWRNAKFLVDRYPNGTMSLTVYTLSLDKSWLNL